MANISVPNNDQTPAQFLAPSWVQNELPTSSKLGSWATNENSQFSIYNEAVGNTFYMGIPNLAGSVGLLANLTNPVTDGSIAYASPQFLNTSYANEIPIQSISGPNSDGGYTVNLTAGVIAKANILVNSQNTSVYEIVNLMIVGKMGGVITNVYPATFQPAYTPGSQPTASDTSSFYVYWPAGNIPASFTNLYVEVINNSNATYPNLNNSLSGILAQTSMNLGNLQYARINGYTDSNDNPQILLGGLSTAMPSITTELSYIESKTFSIQWHASVNAGNISGTTSIGGISYTMWDTTTTACLWQGGSTPAAAQAQAYITKVGDRLSIPSNYSSLAYAFSNGSPIYYNATPSPVYVSYNGSTLVIGLPSSALTNLIDISIDIYFPVTIPYVLLQSMNMNYFDMNSRVIDMWTNVIGSQYGNSQSPAPLPIGTRLATDELNISNLLGFAGSIGSLVIPNGSFDLPGTGATFASWSTSVANGAVITQDTAGQIHGAGALAITTNGGYGSANSLVQIPISPNNNYYIKFKTQSTTSNSQSSITVTYYTGAGAPISSNTMWVSPGTYPSSWTSQYGILQSQDNALIVPTTVYAPPVTPANAMYITFSINGGGNGNGGTIEFDDMEFFQPAMSNTVTVYDTVIANTSTNYTFHTGPNQIVLQALLVGGGGSSWEQADPNNVSSGGGGGSVFFYIACTPDTDYTVSVGAGGYQGQKAFQSGNQNGFETSITTDGGLCYAGGGSAGNSSSGGAGGSYGGAITLPALGGQAISTIPNRLIAINNGTNGGHGGSGTSQAGGIASISNGPYLVWFTSNGGSSTPEIYATGIGAGAPGYSIYNNQSSGGTNGMVVIYS